MKKAFYTVIVCIILTVTAFTVSISAVESEIATLTVNNVQVGADADTVTVTFGISGAPALTSIAILDIVYDSEVFELSSSEWTLPGSWPIKDAYDDTPGVNIAVAASDGIVCNTNVFNVTFNIKKPVAMGEYSISCGLEATDGSYEKIETSVVEGTVTIGECATHSFTEKNEEGALKSEATPDKNEEYYYTCSVCGKIDNSEGAATWEKEGTATGSGEAVDKNLVFESATLTLYNNISVNFNVSPSLLTELGYTNPYMEFEFMGRKVTAKTYTEIDGYYSFEFANVYAIHMGEKITATICATASDGKIYKSLPWEYSVATYCYSRIEKSENAAMRTLAVDILNYGAAAQIYCGYKVSELVNADLTPEQQLLASANPTLKSVTNRNYQVIENASVVWKSANLSIGSNITVRYKIEAASVEGLTVKLTDGVRNWTVEASVLEDNGDGTYFVYFSALGATQFFDTIYATVYNGETAVSNTLTYSIESYAYSKQDATVPGMAELAKSIMRYGSSARAYFESL